MTRSVRNPTLTVAPILQFCLLLVIGKRLSPSLSNYVLEHNL